MKLIANGLGPYAARKRVDVHNRRCHKGKPTAQIDTDPDSAREWLPRYRVRCPACPGEEQLDLWGDDTS